MQRCRVVAQRMELPYLETYVANLRRHPVVVGLVAGCFDLIHAGHTYLLMCAAVELRNMALDRAVDGLIPDPLLIVALNDDASISRLKGHRRPVFPLLDRKRMMASICYVDIVTSFTEDTPVEVIRSVKPDLYFKGNDYNADDLPEAPLVRELGGKVVIVPRIPRSTTEIIERIRA